MINTISSKKKRQKKIEEDPNLFPFKIIKPVGDVAPHEVYGHSAVIDGHKMYVFGGCDKAGKFNNDLLVYNFEKLKWKVVAVEGTSPKGRHFHACVLHNNSLYVFGGKSNGYTNDMHCFDLKTKTWTQQEYHSGKPPSKRYGHSAVVYSGCMYVFGGYDDFGYKSNELFEYRFDSHEWRKIDAFGSVNEKFHHAAAVYGNSMYIFGGNDGSNMLMEYRFGTRTWAKVMTVGKPPDGRWGHSALVYGKKMYICGGCDNVINFKDMHKFDFEKCKWSKAPCSGFEPRYFHSGVIYNSKFYYLAGKNIHNYCFNELYQYNIDVYCEVRPDRYLDSMRNLVDNQEFADIVFIFPEEDKKIYAHKGLLDARCDGFHALLRSGMKEAIEGKIEIKEVQYNIFKALLEYIYTNQLPRLKPADTLDLLKLGDRYMLEHLKSLCERYLKKYIDIENFTLLFEVAEKYKAPELRNFCVKYCVKYYDVLKKEKKLTSGSPLESEVTAIMESNKMNYTPTM
jgi:hypothetical protein